MGLSTIIKKIERFYNIRFQYSDPILGTIKITGKLQLNEDREEIIDRIAVTSSFQIKKTGDYSNKIENLKEKLIRAGALIGLKC